MLAIPGQLIFWSFKLSSQRKEVEILNIQEKIRMIKNALDVEEDIDSGTALNSLEEWDSLGIVSIMALVDKTFHRTLTPEQLEACSSVEDILNYMVPNDGE